jgi:hypothetical protein
MNNETNQSKVHEEVLKEINEQINRISTLESETNNCNEKPDPQWRKFINKITRKNNKY